MKKIFLIGIGVMIFLGLITAKPDKTTDKSDKPSVSPSPTATAQSAPGDEKEQQQGDFLKLYKETIDIVYPIKKIFYSTNGLLTKVPTTTSYLNYKNAEETYKKCSVYFTFASTPVSLKAFKNDFEQSFRELSIACTILQEDAKYMADYINTNNMESYRKSQEELKKGPIKIISNAISRLVYGVGEKIGVDIKPLNDEFKEMSERIPRDFEAEYGK
ncbi:hypothetical protein A2160_00250 [Candidatus Beckwithbacteria bacterium RBG_13_42_9]|uniref:Uncharacterized protein n=1 Tax=Candidatus Beckwithbacteria bacterium RBG_13_42_9 TaxID=1797457 RepID=A0A1F5E5E7_9BACT|nr:MAG: hypothetical protein A2160_00250 [Candidatus Beckwithbacteria bacterium RBG_13_42_9]